MVLLLMRRPRSRRRRHYLLLLAHGPKGGNGSLCVSHQRAAQYRRSRYRLGNDLEARCSAITTAKCTTST